ncbi:MAG TPA: phosphoribosyltransferase family protein, partial [Tepidisphaeraceae bacterium]|nr:phosphoribosyltransferase family protein [Tepidisphaeraceae bacterium]
MPNPKLVRDLHVLLVDDVMTTGATLRSAARALRLGRPRRLSAIVLAVADPHGRSFMDLDPF